MTIKEIAKRANVSLGTVDRVIHDRGKVSKETKEKILRILKEVDYKPNFYARGLVLNKSYVITALVPDFDAGEYWEMPSRGIKQAAKDLNQFGIKVVFFYFDQNDSESFIRKVQEVLELKPDGVILTPVINFEAVKLCARLRTMAIPFSIIDSNIQNSGSISFIGQDAIQSGRLAAKLLSTSTGGKGKILILSIKNNENHNKTLQKRSEGFKDFLSQSDSLQDIKIVELNVDQRESNWKECLEDILVGQNPDGIYVPSSKVHFVAEVLMKRKLKIKLVGNDLIDNNLDFIAAGIIDYIIDQRPETQGYLAVENFYKYLVTKQRVENDYYLPLDIITKENYMYYRSQ
ncbi:substrate-binding domain-containing protein [Zunongwangia sp. F363]|uniref:Substrate-binding domain-containing protein n=1 Tax=Autumnicola tepida TaxID=3075595 RepID=A0ABU3C8V9_9FLAO|nr:substrate-binding domain-containing protein [Zunongwangia sp. F363]MDT0642786.1 substrate-binding domain-containing protein [Zunongwangia sp. F363]